MLIFKYASRYFSPVQTTHNKIEPEKSKHFKQILNLFQVILKGIQKCWTQLNSR